MEYSKSTESTLPLRLSPHALGLIVDASCISGRTEDYFYGRVEWRVLDLDTGEVLLDSPVYDRSTINIGEFCAIVDALIMLHEKGEDDTVVYSDSQIAIAWVKNRKVRTKLPRNTATLMTHYDMEEKLKWLEDNDPKNPIEWWNEKTDGTNIADYGRK